MRPVATSCALALSLLLAEIPASSQGITAQDIARAREDLGSRPTVSTITPGCLRAGQYNSVTVKGLNLGGAQNGRSVAFMLGARRLNATVTSWTNGRIDIGIPAFSSPSVAEAAPISFEIRSETGQAYPGTIRGLHACRTRFEQTIAFDFGICDHRIPEFPFQIDLIGALTAPSVGPGRYEKHLALPEGRYRVQFNSYIGCGDGSWTPSPGYTTLTVDDEHWQQTLRFQYVTATRRVTVPAATITTFVKAALSDAEIHLNNYGPKVGKSYLKRGDAWMKFGPAGGGGTFPIAIEEIRLDPPDPLGRILYYVHDVDSSGVTFTHDAGHYHLAVLFANNAEGIKGEHEGAGISPSMAVNGAKVAVTLRFTPASGPRPDTVVDKVEFSGRVEGGCNVAVFNVCGLVTGLLKNGLPERGVPGLEQRVKEALSDPGTRKAIGDAIWNGLDSPLGRLAISNAAGGVKVSRLLRVSAASADGLEVEFVPGR